MVPVVAQVERAECRPGGEGVGLWWRGSHLPPQEEGRLSVGTEGAGQHLGGWILGLLVSLVRGTAEGCGKYDLEHAELVPKGHVVPT